MKILCGIVIILSIVVEIYVTWRFEDYKYTTRVMGRYVPWAGLAFFFVCVLISLLF